MLALNPYTHARVTAFARGKNCLPHLLSHYARGKTLTAYAIFNVVLTSSYFIVAIVLRNGLKKNDLFFFFNVSVPEPGLLSPPS